MLSRAGLGVAAVLVAVGCGGKQVDPTTPKAVPVAPPAPTPEAQPTTKGHELVISREAVAGRSVEYRARSMVESAERRTRGDAVLKNTVQRMSVDLAAEGETLKVEEGNATHREYRVKHLRAAGSRGLATLLGPGDVITVYRKMGTPGRIEVNGSAPTKTLESVLRQVTQPELTPGTAEDVYGAKGPKEPGDSWPIDGKDVAQFLATGKLELDAAATSGSVQFMQVGEVNGVATQHIVAEFRSTGFKLLSYGAKQRVVSGKMEVREARFLPSDTKLPVTRGVTEAQIAYVTELDEPEGPVRVELQTRQRLQIDLIVMSESSGVQSRRVTDRTRGHTALSSAAVGR